MSSRMNGYVSEREYRPSSEQMADLHVYLVPQDIWREKFNNALNQYIDNTVSLGFIRVDPETRVAALRGEIENQLGSDLIPREYVFVKSVGRSLTRLKGRQENTLKAKNFLPPQAYAPELYLLEATPEVKQALSEGSTRPQTRTSYDYDYQRQSEASNPQHAKSSSTPNGAGYHAQYSTHPKSPSSRSHPHQSDLPHHSQTPLRPGQQSPFRSPGQRDVQAGQNAPSLIKSSASPREAQYRSDRQSDPNRVNQNLLSVDWENQSDGKNSDSSRSTNNPNSSNTRPVRDLRHTSDSDPTLDPSQHHMVSSSRRVPNQEKPSEEFPTPLSATPPHSASEKNRTGNHGNQHKHNDDSGIAGFTPETYRDSHVLDRRKSNSAENDNLKPTSSINDDSDGLNRSQIDDRDQQHWRDQQENENRARQQREEEEEEERRRRQKAEEDRDQDQDYMKDEAKLARTSSEEDLTRYPSPPPLRLASPDRDTASAQARRRREKEELIKELERAKEARKLSERQREELVKHAKQMQSKTQSRRNHARDLWKKRYFEEKKKTGPLEEQCNRLRHELDILHKKLLTTLEGPKEKATKLSELKSSNKNNFKIQATRLQHEIEDVRRRVDHAKMKLTSEMKLRNQAETELRALRAELMQKKINLTLTRNSQLTSYAPPASDVNMYTNRSGITPRS